MDIISILQLPIKIPNIPIILAIGLYKAFKVYREMGIIGLMQLKEPNILLDHIKTIHTKNHQYFVAIVFYVWLVLVIIK